MKSLIDNGANVNAQIDEKLWFRSFTNDYTWVDPAGATPFWRAAQSSDTAAMHLLVEHGADPKLATKAGDTPLHAAAGIGWAANWTVNAPLPFVDAVKYCVELGNDVNAVDNRGYTAAARRRLSGQQRHGQLPGEQRRQSRCAKQGRRLSGRYGERPHALRPAASGNASRCSKN